MGLHMACTPQSHTLNSRNLVSSHTPYFIPPSKQEKHQRCHIYSCQKLQCAYVEGNMAKDASLPSCQIENSEMPSASFCTQGRIIQHVIHGVMGTWLGNLTGISNIKLMRALNVWLHLNDCCTGGLGGLKRLKPSATWKRSVHTPHTPLLALHTLFAQIHTKCNTHTHAHTEKA